MNSRVIEASMTAQMIKDLIAEKLHVMGFAFRDEDVADFQIELGDGPYPMKITLEREVQVLTSEG